MKAKVSSEKRLIRVLIIDDESLARKRVRDLLSVNKEFELIGECSNGKEAIEAIRAGNVDLIFLDIQMRDMNGFDVLEKLDGEPLPKVIFITAYNQFALKAFEIHAIDYLLKPFDDERFAEMLENVYEQLKKHKVQDLGNKLTALLSDLKTSDDNQFDDASEQRKGFQKRLVIKSTGKISFVEVDEVEWIGADGSYVSLNVKGKSHLMRGTLKKVESILDPEQFLRIHRSTIVSVSSVKELKPHFHGEYIVMMKSGKRLKLSRGYKKNVERLLGDSI